MSKNVFKLDSGQLREIALDFRKKVEEGLKQQDGEVKCQPAFIHPISIEPEGKATVIDLTGTISRATVVRFAKGKAKLNPKGIFVKDVAEDHHKEMSAHELLSRQSEFITRIKLPEKSPVGYCFSFPSKYTHDGDAELISWSGEIEVPELRGKPVGKSILGYLNQKGKGTFTGIRVINDTLAALFAGLSDRRFDAYISLTIGTDAKMAAFIDPVMVPGVLNGSEWKGVIPVSFELNGYHPLHLTDFDQNIDEKSDNNGLNRFEKAVSGIYLNEIFKELFPEDVRQLADKFDSRGISDIINHPAGYKKRHYKTAKRIYIRSAKLVAATLAGMIDMLISQDNSIRAIKVTARGNLFWSKVKNCRNYKKTVNRTVNDLLCEMGHRKLKIDISEIENSRLIGTAIAALSEVKDEVKSELKKDEGDSNVKEEDNLSLKNEGKGNEASEIKQ